MATNGQPVTVSPGDHNNKLLAPFLSLGEKAYRALNLEDDFFNNLPLSEQKIDPITQTYTGKITEDTPYSDKRYISEQSLKGFYKKYKKNYGEWTEANWVKFQQSHFQAQKIDFAKANTVKDKIIDENEFILAFGPENIVIRKGAEKQIVRGITRERFFERYGSNERQKPLARNPEYGILNSLIRNSIIKQKDPLTLEEAEAEAKKICNIALKGRPAIDMSEFQELRNFVPSLPDIFTLTGYVDLGHDGIVDYEELFNSLVSLLLGDIDIPTILAPQEGGIGKETIEITDCMVEDLLDHLPSYPRYDDAGFYQGIYDMVVHDALTLRDGNEAGDQARKAMKGNKEVAYFSMVAKIEQVLETEKTKYKIITNGPNLCLGREIEKYFSGPAEGSADVQELIRERGNENLTIESLFNELVTEAKEIQERGDTNFYKLKILSGDKREMSKAIIHALLKDYGISIYPLTTFFIDWLTQRGY